MTKETKSPIKNPPVRVPGQSADETLHEFLLDRILQPLMLAVFLVVLAGIEWVKYLWHVKPSPVLYTVIAIGGVLFAVWKIWRIRPEARAFRLGLDGERAVGQYLEEQLRPGDYQVLHDIPGKGFNLDHVVVGPTGIFCIETKTRSKPAKGYSSVVYDGEKVTVNGFAPDRDPIVQAKAAARWLTETLESSSGKRFTVKPIVIFPGWFVESRVPYADVWVLNEKLASTFIQNAKTTLAPEDIALVTFHLKRYVITATQQAAAKA